MGSETRPSGSVTRRGFVGTLAAISGGSWLRPRAAGARPAPAQSTAGGPGGRSLAEDLAVAYRVLVQEGVLDTGGHLSVRVDSNHFLLGWRRAPELITPEDIFEHDLEGQADSKGHPLNSERYTHAEMYRARPDVNAIVHAHTEVVIMHGFSSVPLSPMLQDTLFFGEGVPVYNIGETGRAGNNPRDARDLAQALGTSHVLINGGHGFNVVGPSIGSVIQRAIYVKRNAEMQAQALAMGSKPPYLRPHANAGGVDTGAYAREWEAWRSRVPFAR